MQYVILALVVAGAVLAAGSLRSGGALRGGHRHVPKSMTARYMKGLTRDDVEALLERVGSSEEPEPVMGAMCYEPIAVPDVVQHVCPACGDTTLFGGDWELAWLERELPEARRLVAAMDELTDASFVLDESGLCSSCGGDSADRGIDLLVTWEDGAEHRSDVTVSELRMLAGLIDGELYYVTDNDAHMPLRSELQRLAGLLGLDGDPAGE